MTPQRAKELLPIITAFANGKKIQQRWTNGQWLKALDPCFEMPPENYRVEPERRLRPWKPEEVPDAFVAMRKRDGELMIVRDVRMCAAILMEYFERVDERGVCHPCGVWEEVEP